MKRLILVLTLTVAASAAISAAVATPEYFLVAGKVANKYEALKALFGNRNTEVYKCQLQEMTDKGTLRKR
jgi:hypothetical protein